ncbi:MAG: T9SS type A sorting domain-containing protein [Cyclobacteriaceae bacterium]
MSQIILKPVVSRLIGDKESLSYSIGHIQTNSISINNGASMSPLISSDFYFQNIVNNAGSGNNIEIKTFPNPTRGVINLQVNSYFHENYIYKVFHPDGKLVTSGIIRSNNSDLDLSLYEDSIYILKIFKKHEAISITRIVKIR